MSLLGSIYKSMSGLLGFTNALDNLSNNIANMNTPGFKGRDIYFRELTRGHNELGLGNFSSPTTGHGVGIAGSSVRFANGDITSTVNNTDLAISGNGFFVLKSDESLVYTRAGQFRFDDDGFLVDPATRLRVSSLSDSGQLQDIYLDGQKTSSTIATSFLKLKGNLDAESDNGQSLPSSDEGYEFEIIGASGESHTIGLNFKKVSNQTWELQVWDEQNNAVVESIEVQFDQEGSLVEAFRYVDFLYNPKDISTENDDYRTVDISKQVLIPTGNATFNLPDAGDLSYITRDGEVSFLSDGSNVRFNSEGYLVDIQGRRLAALDEDGKLSDITIEESLEIPPIATTLVEVSGNLERSLANSSVIPNITDGDAPFEFSVKGSEGQEHVFTLNWTKVIDDQWLLDVVDETGSAVVDDEVINFDINGFIENSDRKISVSFAPEGADVLNFDIDFGGAAESFSFQQQAGQVSSFQVEDVDGSDRVPATHFEIKNGEIRIFYDDGTDSLVSNKIALGAERFDSAQELRLDFGSDTPLTSTATDSNLTLEDSDGREAGSIIGYAFEDNGELVIQFSNGEEETLARIALANFTSLNSLIPIGDSFFRLPEHLTPHFGHPNEGVFGELQANSIEMSNVDLSKEFADIIIVQRGYQASSQVLNVSNELIQELYDSTKGQ